ncbi:hypothetical protein MNR01_01110 [Lysobacter sp. S4-A87]|uniref:hypothetical protein n=1 Tax=Lysobacter sp. S4-A87 TaxID=2925843 RepID=UPI001F52FB1A|nr:hypothetical protein [Lysobacter sp. S4-A87]UNK49671.1 hypothetical protein MNR01_01110 [Lysobacter sp. S4-A87]
MAAVKRKSGAASKTTLRHVWLAGLGLVAVSRREALAAPARIDALQRRVQALAGSAGARVRQVEPCMVQFSSDVEARLAPVLDKLGLKQKAKRPARKARKVAGQAQTRRGARKPAKRAARA